MLFSLLLLSICIFRADSTVLLSANAEYQLFQYQYDLKDNKEDFSFAIISKYLPFGRVRQVGSIGIFDSECLILSHIEGTDTDFTDFLYYDCIDNQEKQITKHVQFIAFDNKVYNYEVLIPNFDYENHWYIFLFAYFAELNQAAITIKKYSDQFYLNKVENLMSPFLDGKLNITVGGGYIIKDDSIIIPFKNIKKYSSFPGILLYEDEIYLKSTGIQEAIISIIDNYESYFQHSQSECKCNFEYVSKSEIYFKNQEIIQFPLEERICDKFSFQFWIKFNSIFWQNNEFLYQIFKLQPNNKDERLINENFSTFQLFYKLSKMDHNKIIFTTYSYDLPTVNLDGTYHQFLVTKEYELNEEFLYSWQSVSVFLDGTFNFEIKLYTNEQIITMTEQLEVYQFHEMKILMQLGNIQQIQQNYINFFLFSFIYQNCEIYLVDLLCHPNCLTCDGPTKSDCLSCTIDRILFQQYKTCICPYNMVDIENTCLSYENLQLIPFTHPQNENDIKRKALSCKFGYYQEDNLTCVQCPSIIKNNQITCLECILNPTTWNSNSVCESSQLLDEKKEETLVESKIQEVYPIIFQFDGNVVTMCDGCSKYQNFYDDFEEANKYFKQFCQISWKIFGIENFPKLNLDKCYNYKGYLSNCKTLKFQETEFQCQTFEKNGGFTPNKKGPASSCFAPFYLNIQRKCMECFIKNCVYCFDFSEEDLSQSTLYKNFEFNNDTQYSVGCALCDDGFQFNFITKKCELQNIQIEHCLRSFINLDNQEICTLSDIQDFSVSLEIINCRDLIPNCLQCIKSPDNQLQCIICAPDYCLSISRGCYFRYVEDTQICLEGDDIAQDNSRIHLIQSFLMSFLPNQYFYPFGKTYTKYQTPYICNKGFAINSKNKCVPYCNSHCLECKENLSINQFECKKCPLNYYQKNIATQISGECIECPQLCLLCQPRTDDQIQLINPHFLINEQNVKFTFLCTKHIRETNVSIDNNFIASYNLLENSSGIQYIITVSENQPNYDLYENHIDINFANQMGIKEIQLIFNLFNLKDSNSLILEKNFKSEVFSLQKVSVIVQGKEELNTYEIMQINFYDIIQIQQIYVNSCEDYAYQFQNDNSPLELIITDLIFDCETHLHNGRNFNIEGLMLEKFQAKNITFRNFVISSSQIFSLNFDQAYDSVFLIDIRFQNCNFTDTTIFQFSNLQNTYIVQNISFINCQFNHSSIFTINSNYEQSNMHLQYMKIIGSNFTDSNIVNSSHNHLMLNNISIQNSLFFQSEIIIFYVSISENFQLQDTIITSSSFYKSELIQIVRSNNSIFNGQIYIKNLNFQQNQLLSFQILQSKQNIEFQQQMQIIFDLMIFEENQNFNYQYGDDFSLIQIFQIKQLQAQNIQIINSEQFKYFNLVQVEIASFINITIKNDVIQQIIPSSINCITLNKGITQLLYIEEFLSLHLENILIINQVSADSPFIQITSSIQSLFQNIEQIVVKNFYFNKNILFKTQSNIILSSLSIYSQNFQNIQFKNITFLENFFHQIIEDIEKFSASLIYIYSTQSTCSSYDFKLKNNYLTNSSYTFILIQANEILFDNIIVSSHNVITQDILDKYYNIKLNDISINHINQIYHQLFQIKNVGGFSQMIGQKVIITNGFFYNIKAQSSVICSIATKGEGIVKIFNSIIEQTQTDITLSISLPGSFNIDSFESFLDLSIYNITFIENFNKYGSSILTVIPSQKQNKIKIVDVIIRNCLSLMNQIFSFDIQNQLINLNEITIQNLNFTLDEKCWIQYFNLLQYISEFDIEKILSSNSIISVSRCKVELSNLYFSGIILGQIVKIINSQNIIFKNVKVQNLKQIYTDDLFYFGQNQQLEEKISIFSCEIKSYSSYSPINQILSQENLVFQNGNAKCNYIKDYYKIIQENKDYVDYIDMFQNSSTSLGSIMYFSTVSKLTNIKIIKFNLEENNCPQLFSGLRFNLNLFDKIIISEFICYKNVFQQFGCLAFDSAQNFIQSVKIKNSFFFQNKGYNGSAITAQKVSLQIRHCYFFNNFAEEQGGAINYQGNNCIFQTSYIFSNKASIGGGLATNYFSNSDYSQSLFLQFNQASLISDNILSQPTHLSLLINDFIMPSQIVQFENQFNYELSVKPYKTLEQGKKIITKYLMLPANQAISDYFNLNPKYFQYFQQIVSIKLTLRNIYNEQLPNQQNFICRVNLATQNHLQQIGKLEYIESQLEFDTQKYHFIVDQLIIIFDPYLLDKDLIILQTNCQTKDNNLNYKIISKIYKCQLGEYYIEQIGCQICNHIQGYYSVKYDTIKCSLFDKTKFKNITSNQIELLPGFWRSNKYSDLTELCFKNQRFCQGGWYTGNQLCIKGNIGGLCEECDILNLRGDGHYFKDSQNEECWDCQNSTRGLIGFILILFWAIFSSLLTLSSIKQQNNLFSSLKSMSKFGKIIFKLNKDQQSILIKMLINYLWIFSAIFTFNITFSFQANVVEQASNPSVFMANSLDCLLYEVSSIQLVYFKVIITFLLMQAQFFIIASISSCFQFLNKENIEANLYSNILIYLYLQNNGAIIKQLSQLLSWRSISETFYISADVSLLYFTENHNQWLQYFIIPSLIVFSLIIPMLWLLLLFKNRNKLDAIKIQKHLGYLFVEYQPAKFYWELVKILKQSIIILILIMFETEIMLKAAILGFILVLYQLLASQQKPFNTRSFNKLDLHSGQLCCLEMFLGAMKFQSEQKNNQLFAQLIQVVLTFLILKIAYPFIAQLLSNLLKNDKIAVLQKILRFFDCIINQSCISIFLRNYIEQLERNKINLRISIGKIRKRLLKKKTEVSEQPLHSGFTSMKLSPNNSFFSLQKLKI